MSPVEQLLLWLIVITILVLVYLLVPKPECEEKEIKCPKCGNKFKYTKDDIIKYKFEGKLHKEVECPRCKNYIEP